jgi:hypothetical protein
MAIHSKQPARLRVGRGTTSKPRIFRDLGEDLLRGRFQDQQVHLNHPRT